jgi:hypothetical protein
MVSLSALVSISAHPGGSAGSVGIVSLVDDHDHLTDHIEDDVADGCGQQVRVDPPVKEPGQG